MSTLGNMHLWMRQTPVLVNKTFKVIALASPQNTVTTDAIDTTGSRHIFLVITDFSAATQTTPTDNKGNTYTMDVTRSAGASTNRVTIFRCFNATVGTGHTWTYTTVAACYPTIFVEAWNAVSTLALGTTNNNASAVAGTTIQPGAITTPINGGLIIAGVVGNASATLTINSSITISDSVAFFVNRNFTGGMGYIYQRNQLSLNPTWTFSASQTTRATVIASYT